MNTRRLAATSVGLALLTALVVTPAAGAAPVRPGPEPAVPANCGAGVNGFDRKAYLK